MKVDINKLRQLENEGYLRSQQHVAVMLTIWNYTQKAQFDRAWTPETLMCRGLITDQFGEVIARPFPKFFNLSEYLEQDDLPDIPDEPFRVFEKLDGSLGITYPIGSGCAIATRGSFTSEQAEMANKMLRTFYKGFNPIEGRTYLFEIIYPENRIVVDYSGRASLVLLDVLDIETGESLFNNDPAQDVFELPVEYHFADINKIIEETPDQENREGFVIRFQNGMRAKLKFDEYVRLHRLVTGINARHIWDALRNSDSLDDLITRVPDEFFKWVEATKNDLTQAYRRIETQCKVDFEDANQSYLKQGARRYFAEVAKTKEYPSILFAMLDEKDYTQLIWKLIKPAAEVPFKEEI